MSIKIVARFFLLLLLVVSFVAPPFATVAYAAVAEEPNAGTATKSSLSGAAACLAPAFQYAAAIVILWISGWLIELNLMPNTASGWQQGANDTLNTGFTWQALIKDCILDAIAWAAINFILQQMLHAVAVWIESGFEGGPAFITDPEGFFTDMADIIAGEMIFGDDLRVLCSPFQLQLQLNVLLRLFGPPAKERNYCRLSDVVTNVSNFLEGSFEDGGWPAWFTVSVTPNQNLWDAMIGAETSIGFRISSRTGTIDRELGDSRFFGIRDKIGKYVAPGKFVQESANKAFFAGQERLQVADEIDEVVSAIIGLIINEVLGPGGLLGLGEAKDTGGGVRASYLDRLGAASDPVRLKNEILSAIDTLVIEAGANPAYADQIPVLNALRTDVEAVNTSASDAAYILGGYYGEVQQIASQMGITNIQKIGEQAQEEMNQQNQGINGPTPPPADGLPGEPGTDPSGGSTSAGDAASDNNNPPPNSGGDTTLDVPPPPPPPNF